MRKFKHKITGRVAEENFINIRRYNVEGLSGTFPKEFIENSSYWEEIIGSTKNAYEFHILSVGKIDRSYEILSYYTPNHYWDMEQNSPNFIESVKRLFDGEVFTIGDKVEHAIWKGTIQKISLSSENNCYISIDCGDRILDYLLNVITHSIPKKPLFVTEDRVEIFEGDEYFRVFKKDLDLYKLRTFAYAVYDHYTMEKVAWHFSTEQAAKDYIIINKPCLSVKDIDDILNDQKILTEPKSPREILKDLVKSKLNS